MNAQAGYAYDSTFFDYVDQSARRSAEVLIGSLTEVWTPRSVLDVGCGRAIWLAAWRQAGVTDVLGIDGSYVDRTRLAVPQDQFLARDLVQPLRLEREFDLVTSLEVAEHLPPDSGETFVASLCRHGKHVLFSAAVPGQGGEHHTNERPCAYWRDHFAVRGYRLFDWLRPRIAREARIEPWYRYNSMFFVAEDAVAALPEAIRRTEVPATSPVPEHASWLWQARNSVLRTLPPPVVDQLARGKHATITWLRRRG